MEENLNDTNENEQTVDTQPSEENPTEGTSTEEDLAGEEPINEEPAEEEPVDDEQPSDEEPEEEQPEPAQSIYEDPNANVVLEDQDDQEDKKNPKTYTPPQKYQQNYQQNYNQNPNSDASPLSLSDSLILVILFAIPCVNLIVALVWAFGGTKNVNRRNISRAELIVWAAVLILAILFYVVFAVTIYNGLTG